MMATKTERLPEDAAECGRLLQALGEEITHYRAQVDAAWVELLSCQHAGDKTGEVEARQKLSQVAPALEASRAAEAALQDRLALLNRAKREVAQRDHLRELEKLEEKRPAFEEKTAAAHAALREATLTFLRGIYAWLEAEREYRGFSGAYNGHAHNAKDSRPRMKEPWSEFDWEQFPIGPHWPGEIYPAQIRHLPDAISAPNFDRLARLAQMMHYEPDFSKPITQESKN